MPRVDKRAKERAQEKNIFLWQKGGGGYDFAFNCGLVGFSLSRGGKQCRRLISSPFFAPRSRDNGNRMEILFCS